MLREKGDIYTGEYYIKMDFESGRVEGEASESGKSVRNSSK